MLTMPFLQTMPFDEKTAAIGHSGFLDGQILIAMPSMLDPRFARSVVYICAHSEDGAMGLVVNQPARQLRMPDLLVQLDVIAKEAAIHLPAKVETLQILRGGPVETQRGFVLHSTDFFIEDSTLSIDDSVSLTATVDILRAMARGEGPGDAVLAMGYAGWSPGQLESEIQKNGWLHCKADPSLLFNTDSETKYDRALGGMGIDMAFLSQQSGRA